MISVPFREKLYLLLIFCFAGVILIVDYVVPLGHAIGTLYIIVALVSAFLISDKRIFYFLLFLFCTLIVLGIFISLPTSKIASVLVNRFISIFVVCVGGILARTNVNNLKEANLLGERFRQALEASPTGMVVINEQGFIFIVNQQIESLFGYDREELIGKKIEILVPERFREQHPSERAHFFRQPQVRPMGAGRDLSGRRKDGKEFPVEIGLNPYATSNGIFVIGSIIDISERKKVDKMKDEFLSSVSHEMRTPLAVLKTGLEDLREGLSGPLNREQSKVLGICSRHTDRLIRVITDILDLSHLESGKFPLRREPLLIGPLIQRTVDEIRPLFEERGVSLRCELPTEDITIVADSDMVSRILINLLGNAARYAKKETCIVFIQEGKGCRISVIDDGPGIDPTEQGRLFKKFEQLSRPEGGGGYKGTGLGLVLCREMVELHGGRIWVESVLGEGAKFHFSLP
ncbi:MAG: PAS domain S-box protein [Deltaproteobacteria bacterium]|nr:PAS domain S-box protein [Deltaproteobacteria bacterium]